MTLTQRVTGVGDLQQIRHALEIGFSRRRPTFNGLRHAPGRCPQQI